MKLQTKPAASAPVPGSADDRATDFETVTGETGEHYSGYSLMVTAYGLIWAIMMAWLFLLWQKQANLNTRLDGLESAIGRAEKKLAEKAVLAK